MYDVRFLILERVRFNTESMVQYFARLSLLAATQNNKGSERDDAFSPFFLVSCTQ